MTILYPGAMFTFLIEERVKYYIDLYTLVDWWPIKYKNYASIFAVTRILVIVILV